MREVLNSILYLNRSGCQWDMLPHDLLPKSTAYEYFAQWRDDGTWHQVMAAPRSQTASTRGVKRRLAPRVTATSVWVQHFFPTVLHTERTTVMLVGKATVRISFINPKDL